MPQPCHRLEMTTDYLPWAYNQYWNSRGQWQNPMGRFRDLCNLLEDSTLWSPTPRLPAGPYTCASTWIHRCVSQRRLRQTPSTLWMGPCDRTGPRSQTLWLQDLSSITGTTTWTQHIHRGQPIFPMDSPLKVSISFSLLLHPEEGWLSPPCPRLLLPQLHHHQKTSTHYPSFRIWSTSWRTPLFSPSSMYNGVTTISESVLEMNRRQPSRRIMDFSNRASCSLVWWTHRLPSRWWWIRFSWIKSERATLSFTWTTSWSFL